MNGIPDGAFLAAWSTVLATSGGKPPADGAAILQLRLALELALSKEAACLIATYIGTGRKASNIDSVEGVYSAEKDCGTTGFLGIGATTVEDAYDEAKTALAAVPGAYDALVEWGSGKALVAVAGAKKSYAEDADKLNQKIVSTATTGAGVYIIGAIAAFLVLKAVG